MSRTRRSFTTEYKVEAAHRVIDSGRTIAEVARELGINEALLGRWVADERGGSRPPQHPVTNRSRLRNAPSWHGCVGRFPSRRKTSCS
ncbi:transposase (plasmid) [Rhodococcus qingshengii]|uniref:transposase n=1 Tax=Rhodococcus TaxID=1827 RepID=UPI000F61A802|nr:MULTISPECIES: transposase [Rhodococcus]AZI65961.1 transposase [Rhodococcus sp. NJ-530]BDQ23954.1 transposase [Rhodococcus qingshengii]